MTALCVRRPPEWWDPADDGARLALALCRVCPHRRGTECTAGLPDPKPVGVIRAGVAYSDAGKPIPFCRCGYPQTNYAGGKLSDCLRCDPRTLPTPAERDLVGGFDEAAVVRLVAGDIPAWTSRADRREALRRLWMAGVDNVTVAARLRMSVRAVRRARQRWRAGVWAWREAS